MFCVVPQRFFGDQRMKPNINTGGADILGLVQGSISTGWRQSVPGLCNHHQNCQTSRKQLTTVKLDYTVFKSNDVVPPKQYLIGQASDFILSQYVKLLSLQKKI